MDKLAGFYFFACILFFAYCNKTETSSYYPNAELNGINEQALYEAIEKARVDQGILSIILQRNDVIIAEEYFISNSTEETHPIKSVTKSVTGILFGMALDKGYIESLDATVSDYLAEYLTPEMEVADISIRNLLTMSGGFEWEELLNFDDYNNWARTEDHLLYAMNVPLIHTPGTQFTYTTPGCQILSAIFTKATGFSLADFAKEHLFSPLQIEGERDWGQDIHGYNYGGVTLNLTARDMLKLGSLYLNNGIYNDTKVLSEQWITESSTSKIAINNSMYYANGYGYLWWTGEKENISYYFANGYGGQFIFVYPDLNMVVVAQSEINNEHRSPGEQWVNTISIIMEDIFYSVE